MHKVLDLYSQGCKEKSPTDFPQTRVMLQLFKDNPHHIFYDVGSVYGYYSLIAGINNWTVKSFEDNFKNYTIFCNNIQEHHLEDKITPIYTKIGAKLPLDYFVSNQHIGLMQINLNGQEIEVIQGLKNSLEKKLIDNIIVKIHPKLSPTIFWIEMILYLQSLGFHAYDLNNKNIKSPVQIKLIPFNIEKIHQIEESFLLFSKSDNIILSDDI